MFGSNAEGLHGGGAARFAYENFGAIWGQGTGPQGDSFGINTMSGINHMMASIASFLAYARAHRDQTFLVTEIGCGIAGYTPDQVAPHFAHAGPNVALPQRFIDVL
ncbi:A1S_2505 family phage non-structural protein [Okibacterium fritillariae]|uniref:A1S_2505 family phage non-structural protein n=1 Tax=Okibacterium fritillariae TaxID=123320 RepID=UPI0040555D48